MTAIIITEHETIPFDQIETLGRAYYDAFAEIDSLAVQRHLMTSDEFLAMCRDGRIRKYLACDETGRILGLSVMTNDLDAWPLISPAYFERHFTELYGLRAIWYIGFVMAVEGAPANVFPRLVAEMLDPIRQSRGMGVLDFCAHNVQVRHLDTATAVILRRLEPSVKAERIDAQSFMSYRFDWPTPA